MEDHHLLRARLEAHEALEPAARVLKRLQGVTSRTMAAIHSGDAQQLAEAADALKKLQWSARDALSQVRAAQAGTLGIRVQTHETPHPLGTGEQNEHSSTRD